MTSCVTVTPSCDILALNASNSLIKLVTAHSRSIICSYNMRLCAVLAFSQFFHKNMNVDQYNQANKSVWNVAMIRICWPSLDNAIMMTNTSEVSPILTDWHMYSLCNSKAFHDTWQQSTWCVRIRCYAWGFTEIQMKKKPYILLQGITWLMWHSTVLELGLYRCCISVSVPVRQPGSQRFPGVDYEAYLK